MVLDAGSRDTGRELRADLLGQQWRDLTAEEAGDLLGLHAQHRLPDQLLVERSEDNGGTECQIGGVFNLHQAPVIGLPEHPGYWAAPPGISIERPVQLIGRKPLGQFLGTRPVIDPDERIVSHRVADVPVITTRS
jgi:hypothetical protein